MFIDSNFNLIGNLLLHTFYSFFVRWSEIGALFGVLFCVFFSEQIFNDFLLVISVLSTGYLFE